jgi:hypothetical protein
MEAMERQVAMEDSARHERYPIESRERNERERERSGAKSVETGWRGEVRKKGKTIKREKPKGREGGRGGICSLHLSAAEDTDSTNFRGRQGVLTFGGICPPIPMIIIL